MNVDNTNEPRELDSLTAEVAAERDYPDGTIPVPLADTTVHVLPPEEWTSTAQQDLSSGRFNDWAADCLAGNDYNDVWLELNDGRGPKLGQIENMFSAWADLTGQQRGKSRELRKSLRNMPRR